MWKFKKSQEEMVGFALIIILVSVILLAFLGFSLNRQQEAIQSYEVGNFIQAFLQYTTDCEEYRGHYSVKELIFECEKNETCSDGNLTCDVLSTTLEEISEESWPMPPYKGYELTILTNDTQGIMELVKIEEGNFTNNNYKGASQSFSKMRPRKDFDIIFNVYY